MQTRQRNLLIVALLTLAVLVPAAVVIAATAKTTAANDSTIATHQQMMWDQYNQMRTQLTADQGQLDDLVAKLDQAKGSARIDALVAVVHELADQQHRMGGQMMAMEPRIMQNMGMHMQAGVQGMMQGMMHSMGQSPMMNMGNNPQGATNGSMHGSMHGNMHSNLHGSGTSNPSQR